jgi:hypothetical protein
VGNAIMGSTPTGQPPAAQPTPTAQPQPNATNQPAQPTMDAHVGLYRKILQGFAAPSGSYVDPQGNVKPTNVSLGRTVLASVIAGMFAPTQYRNTPYGSVVDASATASGAFNAGAAIPAKQSADAQALSDKQQAIKLQNISNSIQQVHLMAALAQQKHQELQGVLDSNQTALTDFKAMDDKQADPSKKIILADKMTFQQALDSPLYGKGKMTTNSILMSGRQSVYDPETGETHEVPLFSILSPEADGVTVSADQMKNFSTINKSFNGMKGIDVKLPIHQYLALQGNLTSVQHFQSFIKRADEQLGIKEDADLAAAVKKDPTLINGVRAAENALAQGGSTADTLQRIQHGTDGKFNWDSSKLFDAMGLDQDKVSQYIKDQANKDAAATERAKKGADTEAKGIASDTEANQILSNPKSTPDQRAEATSFLQLQAKQKATEAGGEAQARTTAENAGKTAQEAPQIEAAAKSLAAGDLTALSDITSMRSDMRTKVYMRAKELNPNFNTGDVKLKMGTQDEFTKGKAGDQIQSFNTFLGHAGEAAQATAAYRNAASPLLNKPLNWIAKNAENDTDYQTFITALQPVRDEYMTFLQNNHALTESDKKAGETIMSDDSTPAQVEAALKQMAKTAFIRLDSLNARYKRTMHQDFPDLLSDDSKTAAGILGLGNYGAKYQTGGSVTGGAGGPVAGKMGNPPSHVVPVGATAGRDKDGNIIGYKTADGKVVTF